MDPIGLSGREGGWKGRPFEDEYDLYLAQAAEMLRGGSDVEEVVAYFFSIQSEHMGLGPPELDERIHEKLLKLVTAIQGERAT